MTGTRRSSLPVRTRAAVLAGKAAAAASRLLRQGGGTAVAGLAAERIDSQIVRRLGSTLGHGCIIVTGTNGKTTTALMLSRAAALAGLRPLHNRSGSNLMRGLAASLVAEARGPGRIPDAADRLGVFEVDEATVPHAVQALAPRAVVFNNLFRDQLDRYGEVDAVAAIWQRTLEAAPPTMAAVLNADDPSVATLAASVSGRCLFFGVDDPSAGIAAPEHAADARTCRTCGADLAYDVAYYGHVGRWSCPRCRAARPPADVRAVAIRAGAEQTDLRVDTPAGSYTVALPLAGLYNVYNALAATAGALAVGLPLDAVRTALAGFSAAFGRQERFEVDGRTVHVLLGKNPAGLNEVLRTVAARPGSHHLLLVLNDAIADGRDVSWVWDADFEILAGRAASLVVSGTRADDLALRLKYAGFGQEFLVLSNRAQALDAALAATPAGEALFVVPTYTAMLELRELLARRGGRAPYWENA